MLRGRGLTSFQSGNGILAVACVAAFMQGLAKKAHDFVEQVYIPDVLAVAWQLEELRVSVFAQPIGAVGPVSVKRITTELDSIGA